MLCTTATFVLLSLPAVLAGFFAIGRWSAAGAAAWLFAASLFFYGYWLPLFTLLLVASICVNFFVGLRIAQGAATVDGARARVGARGWLSPGLPSIWGCWRTSSTPTSSSTT